MLGAIIGDISGSRFKGTIIISIPRSVPLFMNAAILRTIAL